jgi:hypothetical protein
MYSSNVKIKTVSDICGMFVDVCFISEGEIF